jgi:hypothetical protein
LLIFCFRVVLTISPGKEARAIPTGLPYQSQRSVVDCVARNVGAARQARRRIDQLRVEDLSADRVRASLRD